MVAYPDKLKKVVYANTTLIEALNEVLRREVAFENWDEKLYGLYKAICRKGDPTTDLSKEQWKLQESLNGVKVSLYRDDVSIIQFFAAVFDQANDGWYSSERLKVITSAELLQDLTGIFPDFYTVMYEAVGKCIVDNFSTFGKRLAELKSVDGKAADFPKIVCTGNIEIPNWTQQHRRF